MIKKDGSIVYTSFEGRIGHTLSGEFKQTHCTLQDITEKRKAEEALKESERKYSDLYENSPDMHLSVDPETTRIIQCNGTLSKTTGYSKEELINKPLTELYHPHCLEYFRKNLEQFRNTGKIENAELEVLKKNGESMYVLLNSSAVYNKEGKITHSRSIWRDITLQKKLETEEKRLWKILKESLNEIYIFNKDTLKFEFVNDGALRNLGYSLEEIRNLTPVDIKPEYDLNTFRAAIMPILIHEKEILVFETLHKRKDGTLYNVDVHLQLIKYGTEEIFVAIILDITDRKKVEAEIKESEHFIRTVMDNLPIGIAVNSADTSVKFQYINDNFTKFYDVTKDTLSIQDNFWDEVY
jgi:PAS domain S-box-containing protein